MKLTLKALAVCILAVLSVTGSAAVVFGGYSGSNIIQSEENLETALSAADLSGDEIDLKKADSYKVVFLSGCFKYVYIFSGSGSNIVESHVIYIGSYSPDYGEEGYDDFYDNENDLENDERQETDKGLQKIREKAEEKKFKALEKAQNEARKEAEKQAKEAEKAGKLRD